MEKEIHKWRWRMPETGGGDGDDGNNSGDESVSEHERMAAAHMARSLIQLTTRWQRHCCSSHKAFYHLLLSPTSLLFANNPQQRLFFAGNPSSHRNIHFRSRGLRLADSPLSPEFDDSDSDSDGNVKKSRNEKKREARRAVRWAMELAVFSPPQIKRILRVASLGPEVLDALMVAKRLGRDVREGKRRQYSYIGKFLREVEPELMEGLIQATKDGDMSKFQAFPVSEELVVVDDNEKEEIESEDDMQGSHNYNEIASRWFDGLINKDTDVTNEIYSVRSVEFDRQELRRLVRQVFIAEEEKEAEVDVELLRAKKSLTHFLKTLAKQLPAE
ncbi:hypothetical protein LguiB_017124 [Lonicera macranthoides]